MSSNQPTMLLTLHSVRLLGFADVEAVAQRFGQDPQHVERLLIEAGAKGWAARSSFGGSRGWSLTVAGRTENERLLAEELEAAGAHAEVTSVHEEFVPLNTDIVTACSQLQLNRLSRKNQPNDGIDQMTQKAFADAVASFRALETRLAGALPRFDGYAHRLDHAVANAATEPAWLIATDRDSFHRIWFEFHEDLIATLGIQR
jgi:NAD(P)-dependent dehydrogenase (short-subunit alcohol dehydrogenase family)